MTEGADRYYEDVVTPTPRCGVTFTRQDELPDGKALLCCSKCQEMFYLDQNCQKIGWKYHRQSCCALEKDEPRVRQAKPFQSFQEVLVTIRLLLTNPGLIKGRLLLVAFKELRKYLNNEFIDMPADVMYESHVAPYVIAPLFDCMANKENNAMVWAIPGLSSYFLSDELLLTEDMKMPLNEGLPPPEGERCFETEEECRRHIIRTRSTSSKCFQLSPSYCDFVKGIFDFNAYKQSGQEMIPDATPLTVALVKQAFKFWQCRYSRISFPAIKRVRELCANRSEFFFASMFRASIRIATHDDGPCSLKSNELVHGVTVHQFLKTLINDVAFYCCLSEEATEFLFKGLLNPSYILDEESGRSIGPWACFTPTERVDIISLASNWSPLVPRHYDRIQFDIQALVFMITVTEFSKTIIDLNKELDSNPGTQPRIEAAMKLVDNDSAADQASLGEDRHGLGLVLIRLAKAQLIREVRPLVEAYVDIVEPRYRQRAEASGICPLVFPEELFGVIAEYACPLKTKERLLVPIRKKFRKENWREEDQIKEYWR